MSPTPEIPYTDRSPLGPVPLRRLDCLAPRPRPPGEGEGLALFWDLVRTFQGRVNRMDFRNAMLALIKAGRLADAWLLAVQYDREEEIAEQAPIPFPPPGTGPIQCIDWGLPIKGWEQRWRDAMRAAGEPIPRPEDMWRSSGPCPLTDAYRHPDHADADQVEHHPPPAPAEPDWREPEG